MRHRLRWLIPVALLLTAQVWADPVWVPLPGITSTGAGLTEGSTDVNFLLISAPAGVATNVHPYVTRSRWNFGDGMGWQPVFPFIGESWVHNSPDAKWISPQRLYAGANRSTLGPSDPAGTYIYEMVFTLTAAQALTAEISGSWAADNKGVMRLNNNQVVATPSACSDLTHPNCFLTPLPFQITSGFVAGINHLQFVIENEVLASGNPTGLWVNMQGGFWEDTAVPEPAAIGLVAGGLAGLAFLRLRRRARP